MIRTNRGFKINLDIKLQITTCFLPNKNDQTALKSVLARTPTRELIHVCDICLVMCLVLNYQHFFINIKAGGDLYVDNRTNILCLKEMQANRRSTHSCKCYILYRNEK